MNKAEEKMNLNSEIEIRPRLWITNGINYARIAVLLPDDWFVFYWHNDGPPKTAKALRDGWKDWRLATPAELSAAGVPDSQRLVEQQAWRQGVELWDWPTSPCPFISIDDGVIAGVSGVRETQGCPVAGGKPETLRNGDGEHPSNVSSDPRYAEVWQRDHFRDFVTKFRSERREAGLKWSDGYGFVARVRNGVAEFWGTNKKWITYANQVVSMDRLVKLPPATPAQIAQSGCPIADVPPALRSAVEKLRAGEGTLPDGSVMTVGEIYLSFGQSLYRCVAKHNAGFECEVWHNNKWHEVYGVYDTTGRILPDHGERPPHLNRLAQPSDIPAAIDINLVPERIREDVMGQRGKVYLRVAGVLVEASHAESPSPSPAATRTESSILENILANQRYRESIDAGMSIGSRPWEWHEGPERGLCQLKNVHTVYRWVRSPTAVDRISLYAIDNEANPHWELKAVEHISSAELHADYEQLDGSPLGIIRESLGTKAGGVN